MPTLLSVLGMGGNLGKQLVRSQGRIGELFIDCTHLDELEFSRTVTEQPIEDGSVIADHSFANPIRIKLEGSILDDTLDFVGGIKSGIELFSGNVFKNLAQKFKGKSQKILTAYEVLRNMAEANSTATFDVVNYYDVFKDMAIEKITIPKDTQTGERLHFTIELKQIKKAMVKTTSFNSTRAYKSTNGLISEKVDYGRVEPKEVSTQAEIKAKSVLKNIRGR
jgi:hypothetical protein